MKLTIGTDIGGTNTCIGVVDSEGNVLKKAAFKTADYDNAEAYADALAESVRSLMEEFNEESPEWLGMGIGAPNGNQKTGSIEHAPNLKMKGIVPLASMLENRLQSLQHFIIIEFKLLQQLPQFARCIRF